MLRVIVAEISWMDHFSYRSVSAFRVFLKCRATSNSRVAGRATPPLGHRCVDKTLLFYRIDSFEKTPISTLKDS